ncbi:MAG: mycothiol synthase [Rothia sp. (in: high G+C Gram-positive bacteria)]|nr:mycothiol synthase [Rothia sp. (in: high G+C Gram-positive bacteria)]
MTEQKLAWQSITAETVGRFEQLAHEVAAFDGAQPFSEQTLVEARKAARGDLGNFRLLATESDGVPVGFAALVREEAGWLLEAAVAPSARERGLGSALVAEVLSADDIELLSAWVHSGSDASSPAIVSAQKLAKRFGFEAQRELYKLGLALTEQVRTGVLAAAEAQPLPAGLTLTTFTPQDGAGWAAANAAAFAHHPEQGRLTVADLEQRIGSAWFRAEGFFLAKDEGGQIAGSHWTKIPVNQEGALEGEVYAVGVTPGWQGKGLGKALTLAGMAYLASTKYEPGKALERIVLYVDAENTAAVALYRSLGFSPLAVDRQYGAPQPS